MRHFVIAALLYSALAVVAAAGSVAPQSRAIPASGPTEKALPPYVIIVDEDDPADILPLPDSLFNAIAASTVFKVNRTELRMSDPLLRELADSVLPLANSAEMVLVGIDLRGAASPEGPYYNNVRLSRGRAAALRGYMSEHLDSVRINDELNLRTVAEDYARLLWIMEQRNDPDAPRLRAIIDRYGAQNDAAIKRHLQALDGGLVWDRLYREIFPELRSARLVLLFKYIHPRAKMMPTGSLLTDPEMPMLPVMLAQGAPLLRLFPKPSRQERRHIVSVSSNLLADAFYMPNYGMAPSPNVALEFFPRRGNWSFRAAFLFPYYGNYSTAKFFQIRDYHLEVRRYFRPGILNKGAYLGAYVNATKYGIGLDTQRGWQGEGIGGALKLGYVLPLGSGRWRLDFHVAGGLWYTDFDPYVYGNPITGDTSDNLYYYKWYGSKDDFRRRAHHLTWFGPTELGITLSFDLLYYRDPAHGASFRRYLYNRL